MPTLLERYQNGDRIIVWQQLVKLGKGVRHELYYADATAVAAETMRRARHNIELILQRLAAMSYRFIPPSDEWDAEAGDSTQKAKRIAKIAANLKKPPLTNPDVFEPPGENTQEQLRKLERAARGPMPLSLRAWYEKVGGVSLMGSHDVLNPNNGEGTADPLVVAPLGFLLNPLERTEEGLDLWISPDDLHKANVSGGGPYTISVPNHCADAPFEGEWHQTTFVDYLRKTFEWGGFPGWERERNPPMETIAKLTEGLLPL